MRTLQNAESQQEVVRRLATLRADSPRLWGKMSVNQMVCHLSDGFRLYMGEKKVEPLGGKYPSSVLKWMALWAPVRWPKGFQTMKELDQQAGCGTSPVEFARDRSELLGLLERFTKKPRDFSYPAHPHFGEMSEKEWMRLAYLHCDHHLRQFGC